MRLKTGIALLAFGFAMPLIAAELVPIVPGEPEVFIRFTSDKDETFARSPEVQAFCKEFGENILLTPTNAGTFAKFHCEDALNAETPAPKAETPAPKAETPAPKAETPAPEAKEKPPAAAAAKPERYWAIEFAQNGSLLNVDITFHLKETVTKVRNFHFNAGENVKATLSKAEFKILFARMTIEALPMGWGVDYREGEAVKFPAVSKALPPPKILYMYELGYDSEKKLWMPKIVAKLNLISAKGTKTIKESSYKVTATYAIMRPEGKYWVQNKKGINARQKAYEKELQKSVEGFSVLSLFDQLILQSLSSNYGGVRIGKSFLNGNPLVTRSTVLTAFMEIRGGFFEGLRLYYDTSPKQVKGVEHFGWSRFSLGLAFNYHMPDLLNSFISLIDIQPRIGILNLESNFDVPSLEEGFDLNFTVARAPDFGLEIGTEKDLAWFRSRLFAGFSFSRFGVSPTKEDITVASSRFGLDNYFDLFKIGSLEFNGLLYGYYEFLSLSKDPKTVEVTNQTTESDLNISTLGFNLLFFGGGLTVSW